jgi:hypothetical protein
MYNVNACIGRFNGRMYPIMIKGRREGGGRKGEGEGGKSLDHAGFT